MLEDVLLIEKHHRNAAKQLNELLNLKKKSERVVIAIGGESGSGKSELAHMVSQYIKEDGRYAKILHLDDYYKVPPKIRTEWRKKEGIDKIGLNEIDWDTINRNFQEFKEKKQVQLPCVDILTDQIDTLITDFGEVDFLILEGLYAINADADYKVFIDLTYHETKKAQKMRGKEPQTDFRFQVLEQEHQVIHQLREQANILVDKNYQIKDLKN